MVEPWPDCELIDSIPATVASLILPEWPILRSAPVPALIRTLGPVAVRRPFDIRPVAAPAVATRPPAEKWPLHVGTVVAPIFPRRTLVAPILPRSTLRVRALFCGRWPVHRSRRPARPIVARTRHVRSFAHPIGSPIGGLDDPALLLVLLHFLRAVPQQGVGRLHGTDQRRHFVDPNHVRPFQDRARHRRRRRKVLLHGVVDLLPHEAL
ncbi:MAG: hypothetical protein B7Z49_01140, partial [Hydrogenophilales bacterium 12-63-5]